MKLICNKWNEAEIIGEIDSSLYEQNGILLAALSLDGVVVGIDPYAEVMLKKKDGYPYYLDELSIVFDCDELREGMELLTRDYTHITIKCIDDGIAICECVCSRDDNSFPSEHEPFLMWTLICDVEQLSAIAVMDFKELVRKEANERSSANVI